MIVESLVEERNGSRNADSSFQDAAPAGIPDVIALETLAMPAFVVGHDELVESWNKAMTDLSGIHTDAAMSSPIQSLLHDESAESFLHAAKRASVSGATVECRVVLASSNLQTTIKISPLNNQYSKVICFAETIGRASISPVDMPVVPSNDFPTATLDAKGCITGWNAHLESLTGFRQNEMLGNALIDFVTDGKCHRRLECDIADAESGSDDGHLVVNLMTIHASKGMEFDVVFVVGNEEGTLPGAMSLQEGEDSVALQEERRLCYVAMTRAKTRLILTWRKEVTAFSSWSKGGGAKTTTKTRSRFLDVLVANKSKGKPKTKSSAPLRRPNATTSRESANTPSVSTPRSRPLVKRPGKVSDIGSSRRVTTQTATQRRRPTSAPLSDIGSSRRLTTSNAPQRRRPISSDIGSASQRRRPTSAPPRRPRDAVPSPINKEPRPMASRNGSQPSTKTTAAFDSTVFFPVGSAVVHKNFGKGTILQPPPMVGGDLQVRVQFENGRTMDFPAEGDEISPSF